MAVLNAPTLNDRPLEPHWRPLASVGDALAGFGARLLEDPAARENAAGVKSWLDALAGHRANWGEFDQAVTGRMLATACFVWGHAGEDYQAARRIIERRQAARGWTVVDGHRWRHPTEAP